MTDEKNGESEELLKAMQQPFQETYETYVNVLNDAWQKTHQQHLTNQLDIQQRLHQQALATNQDEYNAAQEEIQQAMETPTVDASIVQSLDDAFLQYKHALQTAFSGSNIADMNPATLSAIGKSVLMAAQFADQTAMFVTDPNAEKPSS